MYTLLQWMYICYHHRGNCGDPLYEVLDNHIPSYVTLVDDTSAVSRNPAYEDDPIVSNTAYEEPIQLTTNAASAYADPIQLTTSSAAYGNDSLMTNNLAYDATTVTNEAARIPYH